ncbi:MAG TPA: hypothetical protein VF173_26465 [Thermoanaerobaculia bacterium]|nr:hypothetical protein [Thermoanaerobaculia bacterium]
MSQEKDEVRRLLGVLQTLVRMLAVSSREIERRLNLQHGTIGRLFSGHVEAKLELVLGVSRALGLEFEELFSFLYPNRPSTKPESQAARKIRSMLEDLRPVTAGTAAAGEPPPKPALPLDRGEVKQVVREVLEEIGTPKPGEPKAENGGR